MRLSSVLPLAAAAASLLLSSVAAAGAHSDTFDAQKYSLLDRLLITPATHPNLFSFTGRWLRTLAAHPHEGSYHATLWPGNSVTILFHGEKASVKLLPQPQGWIERYSFVVSVDGEEDIRYDTPGFDSAAFKREGHYIPIQFPSKPTKEARDDDDKKYVLEPHTVRITSIASTPFSFEGLLVENTQISQGKEWVLQQSHRPVLEFIGEGIDAERPGGFLRDEDYKPATGESVEAPSDALFSTVQWQVGEQLGVRHSHISAGACFLDSCDANASTPGLRTQYFWTSPLARDSQPAIKDKFDPRHFDNRRTPFRFPALTTSPSPPTTTATHVIVDVGTYDLVYHKMDAERYSRTLSVFLMRVRNQAHPDAKMLVVARQGVPSPSMSSIADTPETRQARETLFTATQTAVAALAPADANIHFLPVQLTALEDPATGYLRAICPYMQPPQGILQSSKALFMRQKNWGLTEQMCAQVEDHAYRRHSVKFFWACVVLALIVAALWTARSTVVGAVAALLGRRRLGMPEEENLLEGDERDSHGKLW